MESIPSSPKPHTPSSTAITPSFLGCARDLLSFLLHIVLVSHGSRILGSPRFAPPLPISPSEPSVATNTRSTRANFHVPSPTDWPRTSRTSQRLEQPATTPDAYTPKRSAPPHPRRPTTALRPGPWRRRRQRRRADGHRLARRPRELPVHRDKRRRPAREERRREARARPAGGAAGGGAQADEGTVV